MTSKYPSEFKEIEKWVQLIGGPRDGSEFECWGPAKELVFIGYALNQMDDRLGIFTTAVDHVYGFSGWSLETRRERKVLLLQYKHAEVRQREVSGADPK